MPCSLETTIKWYHFVGINAENTENWDISHFPVSCTTVRKGAMKEKGKALEVGKTSQDLLSGKVRHNKTGAQSAGKGPHVFVDHKAITMISVRSML